MATPRRPAAATPAATARRSAAASAAAAAPAVPPVVGRIDVNLVVSAGPAPAAPAPAPVAPAVAAAAPAAPAPAPAPAAPARAIAGPSWNLVKWLGLGFLALVAILFIWQNFGQTGNVAPAPVLGSAQQQAPAPQATTPAAPPANSLALTQVAENAYKTLGPTPTGQKPESFTIQKKGGPGRKCDDGSDPIRVSSGQDASYKYFRWHCPRDVPK